MADPFSPIEDVRAAILGLDRFVGGPLTKRHVFLLLAHEDNLEVWRHFDARFGDGVAKRVIDALGNVRGDTGSGSQDPVVIPAPEVRVNVPPDAVLSATLSRLATQTEALLSLAKEPRRVRVTQRDANGYIVEMEQTLK